ncbi:hypothetical protein GGS24DRAFT_497106 [Hypoxylon argillaceum]|nr:hypothetical protein GGS24DRAFT_497106 [Hypoxylon argillaceum]
MATLHADVEQVLTLRQSLNSLFSRGGQDLVKFAAENGIPVSFTHKALWSKGATKEVSLKSRMGLHSRLSRLDLLIHSTPPDIPTKFSVTFLAGKPIKR